MNFVEQIESLALKSKWNEVLVPAVVESAGR
jgi:hypothetical protein